jgi:ATP/maltotriose-dependent transcriptional regulator MalT
MAGIGEQLVGRDDELDTVDEILEELERGTPTALEVAGEPGIGKTRLLRELAARAEARGHLVLGGSASELEHDLPFSVFVDALDEFVRGLDPERLDALDEHVRAELAHVFPSLWALVHDRGVSLQHERYRSHRAVRQLLELLAQPRPLALVLDDVQWADSASVELMGALLRRPPAAPVLMAIGIRRHQTSERLSAAIDRAHREDVLTRIELGPLSPGDARSFLGRGVDAAEASALYEECGGNPFYLQQLARMLDPTMAPNSDVVELSEAMGVPSPVAAALAEELVSLSTPARRVLEGAAVAGDPFEPELAAAAAGTSDASTMDAVDELLQRSLIRLTEVPRRFRFRHPLVRRAVYETTAGGWRLGAHERCAQALAARGATEAARAHHVERSARPGDAEAVAILRGAGEEVARLAPASAARWFGDALRLLPETASREERVGLLLARAGSLAATGRFTESHADLLDCVEIAPADWHVRVATGCAAIERLLGLQKDAHRHLETALAELDGTVPADAVAVLIELTIDALSAGDIEALRGWAQRAVDEASPLGDRALLAAALAARAWAGAFSGDGQRARAHCDEATGLVDQLPDEELARRPDALAHLASADLYLDRFAATTRHAQRAMRICRTAGQGDLFPQVVAMLGGSLWIRGRPRESAEVFDGAVEAARLAGNVWSLAWNLFNRSFAAFAAGDLDVAIDTAEESYELVEDSEPGLITALSAAVLAQSLLEDGQAERSVDLLLTGAGGEELRLIGGGWRARFLELLTRGLLADGRRADAERAAAAAEVCADEVGLPSAAAMAELAAATLAVDAEPMIAAEKARTAGAALESVDALWDAARARALAGRASAQAGDRDRAALELEAAAQAFDAFGSLRYRDQAEHELRRLGRRIHRRTRPGSADGVGIESLTERELQVARLVVDRMTNPQIAAELFLSQKTVETHLRNIFHKMGVSARAELARAVERADRALSV